MNKRILGRSGFSVSELCFGTMNFGWTIDRRTAFALMDRYHSAGGAFFQAVHVSADLPLLPEAFRAPEEWVGEWFRDRGISRSDLILSSRLSLDRAGGKNAVSLESGLRESCQSVLERFGVEVLDLLICEWSDRLLPAESALEAFGEILKSGLVRQVAVANVPLWRVMEAVAEAKHRSFRRYEALQMEYSLMSWPEARKEAHELCDDYELGLLVTSALGGAAAGLKRQAAAADHGRSLERIRRAAPENASVEQLALAWVLSHPQVSSIVISSNSVGQLTELLDVVLWKAEKKKM